MTLTAGVAYYVEFTDSQESDWNAFVAWERGLGNDIDVIDWTGSNVFPGECRAMFVCVENETWPFVWGAPVEL